jgi:hypothetical protein
MHFLCYIGKLAGVCAINEFFRSGKSIEMWNFVLPTFNTRILYCTLSLQISPDIFLAMYILTLRNFNNMYSTGNIIIFRTIQIAVAPTAQYGQTAILLEHQ